MSKMTGNPKRGDIYWVNFDPTKGTETKKTRPAIILSNDLFNTHLPRLIVVPITSNTSRIYEFDAKVHIDQKEGKAMLDQIRAIDKSRLGKKIGTLTETECADVNRALKHVFGL